MLTRKEREQLEAQKEPDVDPETLAKDMERLALIKKRREEQVIALRAHAPLRSGGLSAAFRGAVAKAH